MNSSIEDWQIPDYDDSTGSPANTTVESVADAVELTPVRSGISGLLILLCMVMLADVCLYRTEGFCGPAVFFPVAALLLILGIPSKSFRGATVVLLVMLVVAAGRLAMNGSGGLLAVSCWLLVSLPFCLRGWPPFLFETLVFAAQSIPGGYEFIHALNVRVRKSVLAPINEGRPNRWLGIGLPVGSALIFGTIFLLANPQLVKVVSAYLSDIILNFQRWLRQFSAFEVLFWATVAWLTAGVLRPIIPFSRRTSGDTVDRIPAQTPMYQPFLRTLVTVIVLFACYLVFEFYTLSANTRKGLASLTTHTRERCG